jgi:hypothetical protein
MDRPSDHHLFFTNHATSLTKKGGNIMRNQNLFKLLISALISISLALFSVTVTWGHGKGTRITPASLSIKSGSELEVTVNGLVGTKTATFRLTGIAGKYELGEFPISSDDFTQVLKIPSDIPYRLTVEGAGKSAKVVITVN